MRAYLITTGVLFGLIVLAHVARVFSHEWSLLTDPWFLLTTGLAVGMCGWAAWLLKSLAPK
jgi:hypothetical protein